jgi:hypothetical protein
MIEKTEGTMQNGQFRETGNIEHTRKTQDEDKTNLKKSKAIPIVKKLEF